MGASESPAEDARRRLEARREAQLARRDNAAGKKAEAAREAARERIEARLEARRKSAAERGVLLPGLGAPKSDGAPSLAKQAAGIVTGLPAGLLGLGADAAKEVGAAATTYGGDLFGFGGDAPRKKGETKAEYDRRLHPLTSEVVASGKRTGGRVVQGAASLAPGGLAPHESEYGAAIREGRIVGTVLEDVGNVAVVGSVAAKGVTGAAGKAAARATAIEAKAAALEASGAAGAASARKAATAAAARAAKLAERADQVRSVARLGEQASGAPARIFTAPAGLAARAVRPAVDRALATPAGTRARVWASDIAETAEVGPVSRGFREIAGRGRAQQGELAGQVVRASQTAEKLLPSVDEQVALSLIVQGEAAPLARLRELEPEQRAAVVGEVFPDGDVTPEAAEIAVAYAEGQLPAPQQERISQAIDVTREQIREPRLERELAGFGRQRGALSPEQVGAESLTSIPAPFAGRLEAVARRRRSIEAAHARDRARLAAEVERAARHLEALEGAEAPPAAVLASPDAPLRARQAGRIFDAVGRSDEAFDAGAPGTPARVGAVEQAGARFAAGLEADAARNLARGERAGARAGKRVAEVRAAQAAVKKAEGRLEALDRKAGRSTERLDQREATIREEVTRSPLSAPARFRPAMIAAQRSSSALRAMAKELPEEARRPLEALADEMPATLEALVAAGLDPEHLIGGVLRGRKSSMPSVRTSPSLPKSQRLSSEQTRRTATSERTIRGQAAREGEEIAAAVGNEVAREVVERFGVKASDAGLEGLAGDELAAAMNEQGLVPWDARRPAGLTGPVDDETVFVPAPLIGQFSRTFGAPSTAERFAQVLIDAPTRAWKASVLSLVPRWHVGNLIGNALMATIGAGLTPVQLAKGMGEARRLLKEEPDALPRELLGRGLFSDEISYLRGDTRLPRGPIGKLNQRSYALNGYVDDLNRAAIYLAKKGDGLSDEAAVKAALRAAGDFDNLTTFERRFVKRLDPFWPWHKHISTLAFRLPLESPARTAWVLHMGELFQPDRDGGSPLTAGDLPLGGDRFLSIASLNPFGAALTSPMLSPGNAVASLGPVWQAAAAAGTGASLRRGGAPMTRPPGTADLDAFGRETATPLWDRPGEFVPFVARMLPQVRVAQDVIEGPKVRYDTGAPMRYRGEELPTGSGPAASVARYFGVPTVEQVDEAEIADRKRRRVAAAAASRSRYER